MSSPQMEHPSVSCELSTVRREAAMKALNIIMVLEMFTDEVGEIVWWNTEYNGPLCTFHVCIPDPQGVV